MDFRKGRRLEHGVLAWAGGLWSGSAVQAPRSPCRSGPAECRRDTRHGLDV